MVSQKSVHITKLYKILVNCYIRCIHKSHGAACTMRVTKVRCCLWQKKQIVTIFFDTIRILAICEILWCTAHYNTIIYYTSFQYVTGLMGLFELLFLSSRKVTFFDKSHGVPKTMVSPQSERLFCNFVWFLNFLNLFMSLFEFFFSIVTKSPHPLFEQS